SQSHIAPARSAPRVSLPCRRGTRAARKKSREPAGACQPSLSATTWHRGCICVSGFFPGVSRDMSEIPRGDLWTIVLAGGEGVRLRRLTRALHGEECPKQFAMIHGSRSLLQWTITRALRWSEPEHIVVVVAAEREAQARHQVAGYGPIDVVAQPSNRGTGPGVLLPLARV